MRTSSGSNSKVPCLQLHRVTRLGDKLDSQIFSFIIPAQLTRGFLQSIQSKEISYGGNKWIIRMEYYAEHVNGAGKDETTPVIHYRKQPLGVSIQLCGPSAGISCQLECVRFTILHQESYTMNLVQQESRPMFSFTNPVHKVPKWIEAGYLTNGHYLFDDWTCILEVEMQGSVTILEEIFRTPRDSKEVLRCRTLETATFSYAGADWSLIIDWSHVGDKHRINEKNDTRPKLFVQRHSSSKHWTRLRFMATVSWHDLGMSSTGILDQLISPESGANTKPYSVGDSKWMMNSSNACISVKHRISIRLELFLAIQISRVDLIPTAPQGGKNCSRFEDPEGLDWIIMSDILGSTVRLKLFPSPDHSAYNTRDENEAHMGMRATTWSVQLIPYEPSLNVVKSMSPYYVIYTPAVKAITTESGQDSPSTFQEVALTLDVEKVCSSEFGYSRPSDNAITLRIEWLHSCMLSRLDYQNYDDLTACQRYHMMRDLTQKHQEAERLGEIRHVSYTDQHKMHNEKSEKLLNPDDLIVQTERKRSQPMVPQYNPSRRINSPRDSLPDKYLGSQTHSVSARASPIPKRYQSPNLLTPPVLINGSPESNDASLDDSSNSGNQWRRHSSCLEDVGSSKPRSRRRLPSPPSRPIISRTNVGPVHEWSSSDVQYLNSRMSKHPSNNDFLN